MTAARPEACGPETCVPDGAATTSGGSSNKTTGTDETTCSSSKDTAQYPDEPVSFGRQLKPIDGYRLCLRGPIPTNKAVVVGGSKQQHSSTSPFPRPDEWSDEEEEDDEEDSVAVAIRTAEIFRGVKIAPDGTILSLNERATRRSGGLNKEGGANNKGKKSRQAALIGKANDLIEEESSSTAASENSEDAKGAMLLYVVGEYNDVKTLVRDGAKKLRLGASIEDINHQIVSCRTDIKTMTITCKEK